MDISEILGSLSQEDIKNLQDIASSVMGGAGTQEKKEEKREAASSDGQNPFSGLDLNAFSNIVSMMSKFGSGDDPRCRLIMSLKPMLSPERQKRADDAIKILKMISLVPVLRDSGLLKGVL